jgi:phage terminase Nu1 subunit (DNA packaging protein)
MAKKRNFAPKGIDDDFTTLSARNVSDMFGVARPTVTEWVSKGCPRSKDGTFVAREVFRWYITKDKKEDSYEQTRQRKMEADAMLSEMKVAEAEGRLVEREPMIRAFERNIATCSQMIQSIPRELALMVPDNRRRDYLTEAEIKVHDILNALSDLGEVENPIDEDDNVQA